jgi:hypothetical protein
METETKFPGPIILLKQAWHIYRERFWVLLEISLIPTLLILILVLLAGGGLAAGSVLGFRPDKILLIVGIILAILVYLAVIYIALWSQTALLFAVKGTDQKVGFKQSFSQAYHKVFSLLGAALLVGLVVGGLMLVGGAIIFALYAFILPHTPLFYSIEGVLGFILALWAIKLAFEFSLASYVVVGDNTKALSAVMRSRDYIKGYWWRVFWRLIFLIMFAIVYHLFFGVVAYGITKLIPGTAGAAIGQVINLVASLVITPLYIVYAYQIYAHLRAVKGESQIPAEKKSVGLIILAVIVLLLIVAGAIFGAGYFVQKIGFPINAGEGNVYPMDGLNSQQMQQLQQMDGQYQITSSTTPTSIQQ